MNINGNACVVNQLERTMGMPEGGPKMIPLPLDFTARSDYELDLSNLMMRGFIDMIQTVYVDNLDGGVAVQIDVDTGRQRLDVAAGAQAYLPILVPNPAKLTFTSTGGAATVTVYLLNFPIAPEMWWPGSTGAGVTWGEFDQVSTDPFTDVAGSTVDLFLAKAGHQTVIWTFANAGANSVNVLPFGWNRVDAADAFDVTGAGVVGVAPGATGEILWNFNTGLTRFGNLKVKSTNPGAPGELKGGFYAA
jgi:hypothetical protein